MKNIGNKLFPKKEIVGIFNFCGCVTFVPGKKMTKQLRLVWPERNLNQVFEILNFNNNFGINYGPIHFGKLEPVETITFDDNNLPTVYFKDLSFVHDSVSIYSPNGNSFIFTVPEIVSTIKLTITTPGKLRS